jgi:cell shape-determining protein MreC
VTFRLILCVATKGRSAFLLKGSSKAKRKRSQLEEVKQEEAQLKADRQEFLLKTKRLKVENRDLRQELEEMA